MYKYLFGPVPSRRLGMSLGIDLVTHKICTLNCIYCECGKTTELVAERKEYVPFNEVIEELTHYLGNNPSPDYVTFSGSGEPTLNSRIGDVISFIKSEYPHLSIALLTNGTLLNHKTVRKEIIKSDIVLPSLDTALRDTFNRMNRPHRNIDLNEYIQGLIDFRKEFNGKIWLEVLILPGYNDNPEDLQLLKETIRKIRPDSVQLNTLDRPGVVDNIRGASEFELNNIIEFWDLANVEIVASLSDRKEITSYRQDVESAIMETIARRPCTISDLEKILGLQIVEINKYLTVLENSGKIKSIRQERGLFFKKNIN